MDRAQRERSLVVLKSCVWSIVRGLIPRPSGGRRNQDGVTGRCSQHEFFRSCKYDRHASSTDSRPTAGDRRDWSLQNVFFSAGGEASRTIRRGIERKIIGASGIERERERERKSRLRTALAISIDAAHFQNGAGVYTHEIPLDAYEMLPLLALTFWQEPRERSEGRIDRAKRMDTRDRVDE